jgi:hypothetical protein
MFDCKPAHYNVFRSSIRLLHTRSISSCVTIKTVRQLIVYGHYSAILFDPQTTSGISNTYAGLKSIIVGTNASWKASRLLTPPRHR